MSELPMELIAGVIYFFSVFAKAMQQRNVAFMNYKMIIPVSYLLSTTDIVVWSIVAVEAIHQGSILGMWLMAIAVGTGGALGSMCAMYIHHRFFTKERFK